MEHEITLPGMFLNMAGNAVQVTGPHMTRQLAPADICLPGGTYRQIHILTVA